MLRVYLVYLRTTLALQLQYRAELAIWMLNRIVEPTVYLVVWRTVAASRGGVGGYDAADFAAYFITLMVVNQLTFTWIIHEFEWRIRSGELSSMLLKPVHPIHGDIADNLGYKVLTLVILVPAAVLLSVLFHPAFEFRAATLALSAGALVVAYLIRFFVDWAFALSAFWTTRTSAINQIYFLLLLFCSGRLAPLELFPRWLERITWYLPFRWTVSFPVELALGRLSPELIAAGFRMQALWLALGLLLLRAMWRLGVRKYAAVGS
ncbi:MAG: ABC-2 family transporter protein [Spirochaetaceae bacterium]|nr:ABC-2 family transporter protein [Spirochaetaceae bacterium]